MELKRIFEIDSIPGDSVDEIEELLTAHQNWIERLQRKKLWLGLCPHLREFLKRMVEGPIEVEIKAYDAEIITRCKECRLLVPEEINKWYEEGR